MRRVGTVAMWIVVALGYGFAASFWLLLAVLYLLLAIVLSPVLAILAGVAAVSRGGWR